MILMTVVLVNLGQFPFSSVFLQFSCFLRPLLVVENPGVSAQAFHLIIGRFVVAIISVR